MNARMLDFIIRSISFYHYNTIPKNFKSSE